MRIFLLNPGESGSSINVDDHPGLTDIGRAQVEQVVGHICDVDYYKNQAAGRPSNFTSNTSPKHSPSFATSDVNTPANFYYASCFPSPLM